MMPVSLMPRCSIVRLVDAAHRLLHAGVLRPGAGQAGELDGLLPLPVHVEVVVYVVLGPPRALRAVGPGREEAVNGGVKALLSVAGAELEEVELLLAQGPHGVVGEADCEDVMVVHRDVGVAAEERVGAVRGDDGVEGEHELGEAPVIGVLLRVAARADEHPVVGVLDLEAGVAVAHLVDHPLLLLRGEPEGVDEVGVEETAVAGVDLALDGLEVVVLGDALGEVAVGLRHQVPLEVG